MLGELNRPSACGITTERHVKANDGL
jgi:hypothetical protein